MQNSREQGKQVARVGAIVFLLLLVALGLWLYAGELSKMNIAVVMLWATVARKSAVLIACATMGASVLSIGRFLTERRRKETSAMRTKLASKLKRVRKLAA